MIGVIIGLIEVIIAEDLTNGFIIFGISLIVFFGGLAMWRIDHINKRIDTLFLFIRQIEKKAHIHGDYPKGISSTYVDTKQKK